MLFRSILYIGYLHDLYQLCWVDLIPMSCDHRSSVKTLGLILNNKNIYISVFRYDLDYMNFTYICNFSCIWFYGDINVELYVCLVMPIDRFHASSTSMRFMNNVLRQFLGLFVVAYCHDYIVYSHIHSEYYEHIDHDLQIVHDARFDILV